MATPDTLEHRLADDLRGMDFADERFCEQLYRALAGNAWSPEGEDGEVALSYGRAEDLVNRLRRDVAQRPPLALAQTGGEGEVSRLVSDQLLELGWRARPLDTSTEEDAHVERRDSPPPAGSGALQADRRDAPGTLDPAARRSGSFQAGHQAERQAPDGGR